MRRVYKVKKDEDSTYVPENFLKGENNKQENPREQRSRQSTLNGNYQSRQKTQRWTIKEKVALFEAMKKYGCADYKNLAKDIEVRDAIEVKNFLEKNMERVRKSAYEAGNVAMVTRNDKSDEEKLEKLMQKPPADLWQMIMSHSILPKNKSPDYSQLCAEFFKQCAEEEAECTDPKQPDFKKLYSFVAECCTGNFAGDLKPLDALVLGTAITKVNSFAENFTEERKFLENYNGPPSFIPASYVQCLEEGSPFELEQLHQQMKLLNLPENGIPLEDDKFNLFHQNTKFRENLNPLGLNPAMLAEEEEKLFEIFQSKFGEQ